MLALQSPLSQMVLHQQNTHMEKINLTPTSYDIQKIQFQVDFSSVKINIMKLLENTI